jgi:hypothetical protein
MKEDDMKKIVYILFVIIITVNVFCKTKKYQYDIEELKNKDNVKIKNELNMFYPVYYIHYNLFAALDLYNNFNYDERIHIIEEIVNIIMRNNIARLTIKKYYKNKDLIIVYKPTSIPKYPKDIVIFFTTNYSFKSNKIVSGDDMKDAYGTYYYIKDNKMIKYQKIYNKDKELKIIEENDINIIADFYIFDEKIENDEKGKNILENGIENTKNINDKFIYLITLSEYYLMKNDLKNANESLKQASLLLNDVDEKLKNNYNLVYGIINDVYKYLSLEK